MDNSNRKGTSSATTTSARRLAAGPPQSLPQPRAYDPLADPMSAFTFGASVGSPLNLLSYPVIASMTVNAERAAGRKVDEWASLKRAADRALNGFDTRAITNDALYFALANDPQSGSLNSWLAQGAAAAHPEIYNQWRPATNLEVAGEGLNLAGLFGGPATEAVGAIARRFARAAGPAARAFGPGVGARMASASSALAPNAELTLSPLARLFVRRPSTAADFEALGFNRSQSAYLEAPYHGDGHHYYQQGGLRLLWPFSDRKIKLHPAVANSRYFRLRPPGINRGDMYRLHYENDRNYGGSNLPADVGGGRWDGKVLKLEQHTPLGRFVFGAPRPLKLAVGGAAAAGLTAYELLRGESGGGVLGRGNHTGKIPLRR
jgi:hypothetical protein